MQNAQPLGNYKPKRVRRCNCVARRSPSRSSIIQPLASSCSGAPARWGFCSRDSACTHFQTCFSSSSSTMSNEDLVSVDYEVFGRVQGVFFRKYTQVSLPSSLSLSLSRSSLQFYSYEITHIPFQAHYPSSLSVFIIFQAEGKKLGLVGWVQNTDSGTVQGQLQGPRSKVKEMQKWLKSTGSPKSRISKAEFKNEKTVDSLEHSSFSIVK